MRLNAKDKLFGEPILEIRAVVRAAMKELLWGDNKSDIENKIAKRLDKSPAIAAKVLTGLIEESYLVLQKEKYENSFYYKLGVTDKGHRFGVAPANPPISREKADLLLAELIERAKMINGSEEYVYHVQTIKVFGSYLSDKTTLGDLDVAVRLSPKFVGEDFTKANFKRIEAAIQDGKVFKSFFDKLCWPHKEVILKLKTRKKGLSLHDEAQDEVVALTKTKTVYVFEPL